MDKIGGFSPPMPPVRQAAQAKPPEAARAAEQLEAHFLQSMISQMHGESTGGYSGSVYRGMMDEALAGTLAKSSPLGLSDMVVRDMAERTRSAPMLPEGFTRISSPYGMRAHPISGDQRFHHGWDLPASVGAPVAAARAGQVVFSGDRAGYGELIEIRHDDGSHSLYAHLSKREANVGAWVEMGTKVGEVGSTGASTGPHLHFEVRTEGKSVDPGSWLTVSPVASTLSAKELP
jgi:murein DD-endopeptidase MepM/ murein hydrolase activator NlpD